ncbi:RHS repeat-associated core domain-containing protein [Pseudomonas putida]|nr:RHS repeat-associated core domain-containing protein [Pseudomonas putida]
MAIDGCAVHVDRRSLVRCDWAGSALGISTTPSTPGYSAYGHVIASSLETSLAYAGQYLDRHTAGYLLGNGHRLYDPGMMRFCQPDSVSPFGAGGINTYTYCQGDPIGRHDPSGQNPVLISHISAAGSLNRQFRKALQEAATSMPDVVIETLFQQPRAELQRRLGKVALETVAKISEMASAPALTLRSAGRYLPLPESMQNTTHQVSRALAIPAAIITSAGISINNAALVWVAPEEVLRVLEATDEINVTATVFSFRSS